jgi:dihydrofolate reductase
MLVHSLEQALQIIQENTPAFIIGGGEIYAQGMSFADTLEITRVHGTFEADAFFPPIDREDWHLSREEFHDKDDNHAYAFTYRTYTRITDASE